MVTKVLASRRGQGHRRPHLLGPGTPAGVHILLQVSQGQGQRMESSIHPGILWAGLLFLEVTGGNLGMRTMVTCVKFQALLGWTPQTCPRSYPSFHISGGGRSWLGPWARAAGRSCQMGPGLLSMRLEWERIYGSWTR